MTAIQSAPREKLSGKRAIRACTNAASVVLERRFSKARRFTQTDAARDDGLINELGEVPPNFADNLRAQVRPAVEHRHDDAANPHARVRAGVANLLDDVHDLNEPF